MSLITIFRGDAKTLAFQFTQDDGQPMNVSGYAVFLGAAINYSSAPIIYVGTTGNNTAAVTGLINLQLTSGDTNICPGDYPASVRAISPSGVPSTFPLEGISILPSILPYG